MKLFIQLAIINAIVFVLFDQTTAIGAMAAFLVLRQIPARAWFAIANGVSDMMPWIMINAMLDD